MRDELREFCGLRQFLELFAAGYRFRRMGVVGISPCWVLSPGGHPGGPEFSVRVPDAWSVPSAE